MVQSFIVREETMILRGLSAPSFIREMRIKHRWEIVRCLIVIEAGTYLLHLVIRPVRGLLSFLYRISPGKIYMRVWPLRT